VFVGEHGITLESELKPEERAVEFLVTGITCDIPQHVKQLRDVLLHHCGGSIKDEKDHPALWRQLETWEFMNSLDGAAWGSPLIEEIIHVLFMGESHWSVVEDMMDHERLEAPLISLVVSLVGLCLVS
jgi:hypothetical protein